MRNRYKTKCALCHTWLEPGQGQIVFIGRVPRTWCDDCDQDKPKDKTGWDLAYSAQGGLSVASQRKPKVEAPLRLLTNKFKGACKDCKVSVDVGQGKIYRDGDKWVTLCATCGEKKKSQPKTEGVFREAVDRIRSGESVKEVVDCIT